MKYDTIVDAHGRQFITAKADKRGSCKGCDLKSNILCEQEARCIASDRSDGQDIIYKKLTA